MSSCSRISARSSSRAARSRSRPATYSCISGETAGAGGGTSAPTAVEGGGVASAAGAMPGTTGAGAGATSGGVPVNVATGAGAAGGGAPRTGTVSVVKNATLLQQKMAPVPHWCTKHTRESGPQRATGYLRGLAYRFAVPCVNMNAVAGGSISNRVPGGLATRNLQVGQSVFQAFLLSKDVIPG